MKLDLIFPVLPPVYDGIGDYTARLAAALRPHAQVRILTAQAKWDEIPGVTIERVLELENPRNTGPLLRAVQAGRPDWVLLQYNPFSYGRWGLNPFLPFAVRRLRRRFPDLGFSVMFHERYVPIIDWKFAVMATWQRWQFRALGRQADPVFFSIEPWADAFRRRFPGKRVVHLPVGSNMPRLDGDRSAVRHTLGLPAEAFVLGWFGSAHASRLLHYVRAAGEALRQQGADVRVLYIGADGDQMQAAVGDLPLLDAGRLEPEDVSRSMAAMDVYLAPFIDGISTRRGSFMVGIQHGLPTVATLGEHTDTVLRQAGGEAYLLAPARDPSAFTDQVMALYRDPARRRTLGAAAEAFYHAHFDWPTTASKVVQTLKNAARPSVDELVST